VGGAVTWPFTPRPGPRRKGWSQPNFWETDDRLPFLSTWPLKPDREPIGNDYAGYIRGAYKASGPVFACIRARQQVFSQARYLWTEPVAGSPSDLVWDDGLALLDTPWPNGTLVELAARMDLDVSLAGNFFATTADDKGNIGRASVGGPGRRVAYMRPDWVQLIIGSPSSEAGDPRGPYKLDARVVLIEYKPRNVGVDVEPVLLLPSEVCHHSPQPDPEARFRGMSWLTPVLREIASDKAATKHKLKFFENAATPNVAVSMAKEVTPEQFELFMEAMDDAHKGVDNAWKTLYTAGGADVTVIGKDLRQLDFKSVQGAGETRIASAAGVHPVIALMSEGMQGSTLNDGNFRAAKRLFAETTCQHLWAEAAPSLQALLTPPRPGMRLWADTRGVSFLHEDAKDQAEINRIQAETMRTYTDAGFTWESAKAALAASDVTLLEHTGLFSVQLRPPGTTTPDPAADPDEQPDPAADEE